MTRDAQTSWQGKVLLACLATIAGLGLVEGTARLLFSPPGDVVPRQLGRFDPTLGWSMKPSSHAVSTRTGYEIDYRINSKGLRDDETSYEKPAGTFRIVLLGDSRTFGFGVPVAKHFARLLEGYFKNVEVINMGVGGFGVDQELLYLRSEGFRYQPDLVMTYVAHYGEHRHMHTIRWEKQKPRFVLKNGALVLENSPVKPPERSEGLLEAIWTWPIEHSRALRTILARVGEGKRQQEELDRRNAENEAFMREVYRLGEELVYAMGQESSARGVPFVLMTNIPELHRAVGARKMLSLDARTPLANHGFDLPDGLEHINEAGNGVLAWEIARFLQANGLIPAQHVRDDAEIATY